MRKIFLISLLCLGTAPYLFALGRSGKDGASTLEFWSTDPELKLENQAMIDAFEQQTPDARVNLSTYDPADYWTKIRLQAQQNKLPDTFAMSSGYAEEWIGNGLLLNVSEYIQSLDAEKYYLNFFEGAKKIANTDEDYLIPYAEVLTLLFYNKDMFDQAGIAYPDDDWSWDEFLAAAKALTNDAQWGFWFYGRYAHIDPWVFRNGGRFIDRSNYTYAPDQNAMDAIRFLLNLVLVEKVAPSKKQMSAFRQQDVFPQGKAAMWVDGSWNIANIRKIVGDKFRWGFANVPLGPNGSADAVNGWADSYVIGAKSKSPDLAWQFLQYAISDGAIQTDALLAGENSGLSALCGKIAEGQCSRSKAA